jgi:hypothetical protein
LHVPLKRTPRLRFVTRVIRSRKLYALVKADLNDARTLLLT